MSEREIDDGLWLMYNVLKDDEVIQEYCYSERDDDLRISFFKYPETADMSGNWIVLESIINGLPSNYADSTWVAYDYLLHVEVWSKKRDDNMIVAKRIRDLLWEHYKFKQNDSIDEYDVEIYRDARRYTGKLHRSDLDNI